jgi:hypothetical protein
MVERILFIPFDGLTDQIDREVGSAHLLRNDTQQVQRVGMAGVGRQHTPIISFGFGQSSGLVMFEARPQQFGGAECSRGGCGCSGVARSLTNLGRGPALFAIHGVSNEITFSAGGGGASRRHKDLKT